MLLSSVAISPIVVTHGVPMFSGVSSAGKGCLNRGDHGRGHIGDMDEVASLTAIFEDSRRLAAP